MLRPLSPCPLRATGSTSRRAFLAGLGGAAALGMAGCGGAASATSEVRFFQSKPEVIPYFADLLGDFAAEHPGIRPVHEIGGSLGGLAGTFVRNDPPDLGCLNYNYEMANFRARGELSNLADLPQSRAISPLVQDLVDLYPGFEGQTSVMPYSMMAASVIYNRDLFEKHDVAVPTTHSEFIAACKTFEAADVTPIYSTFGDAWTVMQGLVDYSIGGMVDVIDFYSKMREQGADVTPDSPVSFSRVFREPLEKMLEIAAYSNADAAGRKYGDGNVAFANGGAAMYLQGPWALLELEKLNPDIRVGTFPLPMTEDAADNKVRVNLDLSLWIPEKSNRKEEARTLLRFLTQPAVQDAYNAHALGFGVRKDAPPVEDERLLEMQPYVDRGAFYQGASQGVPRTIPFESYSQAIVYGADLENTLRTLDADWARLARRS
ncbi:ABC transporter substrate-binding protein [Arthrobacter sp. KK5.5]|uniref:ABC transporter substrate-binding protein n=1 Tax=Arthrobacter sp. KK5.5 TaxID=3373084 RepID=UPI003EE65050